MKTTVFQKTMISTFMGVALFGSTTVFAANEPTAKNEAGKIISVDAKTHTLVVASTKDGKPHTFQWNEKTKVTLQGTKGTEGDLRAGEKVSVKYGSADGKMIANEIYVMPAKATTSAKPVATQQKTEAKPATIPKK